MEVIEFEELSGLIFPQTVVNEIQQSSLKHYRCGRILLQAFEGKNGLTGGFVATSEI